MPISRLAGVAAGFVLPVLLALAHPAAYGQDDSAERQRIKGVYEASAEALEAMRGIARTETFRVSDLAATLAGKAPEDIAAWVAENVQLVPYLGVLKGPSGALEDQRANSLDRALLLQALLAANGHTARLARSTLDAQKAEALLTASRAAPAPEPHAVADVQPILDRLMADPRIDGAKMEARIAKSIEAAKVRQVEADTQIGAISTRLADQLAPVFAASGGAAGADAAALADHWWVQVSVDGVWRDLDPSAAAVGALATTETMEPRDLPASLRRSVTIRVIAEFARDGAFAETVVLSRAFDPAEAGGRVIALRHRALDLPSFSAIAEQGGDFDTGLVEALAASSAWVPMLVLGDEVFTDKIVATDGEVTDATEENIVARGGGGGGAGEAIGGAIAGMGDDLDGEGPYDENAGPAKFTAAFVEVETAAPGGSVRVERRALFDLAGPAARAAGTPPETIEALAKAERGFAMLDNVEIMMTTGRMAPDHLSMLIQNTYAAGFKASADWIVAGDASVTPDFPPGFRSLNLPLHAFAAGRTGFGPNGDTRLQVEANVVMTRAGLRLPPAGGAPVEVYTFDILDNRLSAGDQAANLTAGVADTLAELDASGYPDGALNTALVFAAALEKGESWTLISPGDSAGLDAVASDPVTRAAMLNDLARGYALAAPAGLGGPQSAVWWRVDPVTGETLGMSVRGGSVFTEYNITVAISIGNLASCFYKMTQAGKDPSAGKLAGIGLCLLGASIGGAYALAGKTLWQVGAITGASGVAGNFADP